MSKKWLLSILMLFSCICSVYPKTIPDFEEGSIAYYKAIFESKLAFQNKDFDRAVTLLQSLVTVNPNNLDTWSMLGTIYLQQTDYVLAKNAFAQAINVDPGFLPAYQGLAISQEYLGEYENALMNYSFFIQNFDGQEKDLAIFKTAELLCWAGKYYDAIPLYQQLKQNFQSKFSKKAGYYRKNITDNMAIFKGQRKILKGVARLVPQQNNCMPSALAANLIYWGEPTTTKELAQHLMASQEGGFMIDMIDYTRNLGFSVLLTRGNIDDIISWLNKDIPVITTQILMKDNAPNVTHLRTIFGYDKIKESVYASDIFQLPLNEFLVSWEKADNTLCIIVPKSKSHLLPQNSLKDVEYIARADKYYALKQYDSAYQAYLEAEIENETSLKAKLGQAKSLLKSDKIRQALKQLEDIVGLYPNSQEAHFLTGIIYFNRNEPTKALQSFEKCILLEDKDLMPEIHNFLGYLYIEKNDYYRGIKELNSAISLKPGYMHPHYNLAIAYTKLGDPKETIKHLRICIEQNFKSFEDIQRNPVFKSIITTPDFQKLQK